MLIRRPPQVPDREITSPALYLSRRRLLGGGLAAAATVANAALFRRLLLPKRRLRQGQALAAALRSPLSTGEAPTPYEHVTGYNNFYELATDKYGPARLAAAMRTRPWTVAVEGAVARPRTLDLDWFLRPGRLEERVYRLRCVEGWSMVIPWIGLPLRALLDEVQPTGQARYVEFVTRLAPEEFPEQRGTVLAWPYVEGLRLDEAMHPLTLLAVGLYGEVLPGQNGAPLRLVVPWKYGFKSIKSIVRIRLRPDQPLTTWMEAAPEEYGFYANVNPQVAHPRWSQATERRIGEVRRRPTLPFNGYGEQVAGLYAGLDLRRWF